MKYFISSCIITSLAIYATWLLSNNAWYALICGAVAGAIWTEFYS